MLPLLAMAAAAAYMYIELQSSHEMNIMRVSGNIEVTDAEVSFKIAGHIERRPVSEGETVTKGTVVALLDSADLANEVAIRKAELWEAYTTLAELEAGYRPEEIEEAQAAMQRAEAYLHELLTGSRPQEIAAAEATVARAKADIVRLERDFHRMEELHRKEVISTREYDASRASYDAAAARLREAEEQLKLVQEGPRHEEIERARARVERAKEARALAETRLSYARLVAPLSGVVLSENAEPGEYVSAGTPVVTIGDLEHVWLRAYINEPDLGRVKVGQRVRVTTDTYPDKGYEGQLSFIASQAEFTPKNVQTDEERVKLVYRIKVDIPNPHMELKPGMPADAEIVLNQAK